jgi:hypothetical protein
MLLDIWKPSAIDRIMPACARSFHGMRYKARRFKFTDEVTASLARLIRDFPNALLDNYQFALPPYPCCYLEFNLKLFIEELGGRSSSDAFGSPLTDHTIGYLINDHQITTLIQSSDQRIPPITGAFAYTYVEHRPLPGFAPLKLEGRIAPDLESDATEDLQLGFLLGTTLVSPRASLTPERAHDLVLRIRPHIDGGLKITGKSAYQFVFGAMGEARNFMALLMWLNQPKVSHVTDVAASRGWFDGKPVAYAAHHIVRLRKEVTQRSVVKAFAPRRAPRRHEVEGFWRNYEKTPGCVHNWPILPDEHGHWHCQKCPQWRTRVRQHERGDATVGFVTKEYTT